MLLRHDVCVVRVDLSLASSSRELDDRSRDFKRRNDQQDAALLKSSR